MSELIESIKAFNNCFKKAKNDKDKFDIVNQLSELDRSDKVIIIIDSIGNIASKKEIDDAENMKSVADMTRAKALKGLFRMVTPFLSAIFYLRYTCISSL